MIQKTAVASIWIKSLKIVWCALTVTIAVMDNFFHCSILNKTHLPFYRHKVFLTWQQLGKTFITPIKLILNPASSSHLFFPTVITLVWLGNSLFPWHLEQKPLQSCRQMRFYLQYLYEISKFFIIPYLIV